MNLTTVGVLARIDLAEATAIRIQLAQLEGVELFEVGQEDPEGGQIGILIEAASIDAAHDKVKQEVLPIPGVWSAWPVYMHLGDEDVDADGMVAKPDELVDLCAPT